MKVTSRFVVIGAVGALAIAAWAQQGSNSNSTSNSKTGQGNGSVWGSASSSARGSGSSSSTSNGSGSQSGHAFGNGSQNGGSMPIPNYAVILMRNPRTADRQIEQSFWREEVAYWQQLANRGAATMAGNWREWNGGLVLLSVRDDQTAQTIADNDPGVKKGIFTATVKAWEVRVVGNGPNAGNLLGNGGGATRSGGGQQSSSSNNSQNSNSNTRSGGG